MTIRLLAFALPALLLAACATAPGTTARIDAATAAQLEKEVAGIERAFAKTMADRDHAAFASFIAEDASFRSPEGPIIGKASRATARSMPTNTAGPSPTRRSWPKSPASSSRISIRRASAAGLPKPTASASAASCSSTAAKGSASSACSG